MFRVVKRSSFLHNAWTMLVGVYIIKILRLLLIPQQSNELFFTVCLYQPSLIFLGKAGTYLSGADPPLTFDS